MCRSCVCAVNSFPKTYLTHLFNIRNAISDLVPFVQFKNREKHPGRSVTFSTLLLKVKLLHRCFSCFLNYTNGSKSRKASHI